MVRHPFNQGVPKSYTISIASTSLCLSLAMKSPLPGLSRVQVSLGCLGEAKSRDTASRVLGCSPPLALPGSAPCPLVSCADSCRFALHARSGELTRFTTPGFPDSPYPAFSRCQWTLRGDASSVLSLTFRSFDVATCDDRGSDLVVVYDTLSPVEPRAVVR